MNLIINARDAMPEGGTIVVAGAQRRGRPRAMRSACRAGDYVVLAVADDGSGIPPRCSSRSPSPSSPPRTSARAPASACRWSTASPSQSGGGDRHRQPGRRGHHRRDLAAAAPSRVGRNGGAPAPSPRPNGGRAPRLADPARRRSRRGPRDHRRRCCATRPRGRSASDGPGLLRKLERGAGRVRPHHHRLCDAAPVRRRDAEAGARDPAGECPGSSSPAMPTIGPWRCAARRRGPPQALHAGPDGHAIGALAAGD